MGLYLPLAEQSRHFRELPARSTSLTSASRVPGGQPAPETLVARNAWL